MAVAGGGVASWRRRPAADKVEAADKDEEVGVAIIRRRSRSDARYRAERRLRGSVVVERVKSSRR
ncbi:MAG: hypothetical protein ACLTDR_15940 [Adlercreutzia equolifaciens]